MDLSLPVQILLYLTSLAHHPPVNRELGIKASVY